MDNHALVSLESCHIGQPILVFSFITVFCLCGKSRYFPYIKIPQTIVQKTINNILYEGEGCAIIMLCMELGGDAYVTSKTSAKNGKKSIYISAGFARGTDRGARARAYRGEQSGLLVL